MNGEIEEMRWGFRRSFSNAVVNARQGKLTARMWKESAASRQCIVPAVGYYEWSGPQGQKRTHLFTSSTGDWLWIAGIWEEDAELGKCFSMITTEPTGAARGIHDRMPAVLSHHQIRAFLNGEMHTFSPHPDILQVADAVNPLTGRKPGPLQQELL